MSPTGVAGLTLGGGLGWLVRKHGLACDNLFSADVVTAEGKLLRCSETQNPDLFWGLRGGGGNFGIVTSFEFRVHDAGTVTAGLILHPIETAADVLRDWADYMPSTTRNLTSGVALMHAPPAPFVPEEWHGKPVLAVFGVHTGPLDEGAQVVAPLSAMGQPIVDIFQPMPFFAAQTMLDTTMPDGLRNYWKTTYVRDVTNGAIETLIAQFAKIPSRHTLIILEHNGDGAVTDVAESETAFAHRDIKWDLLVPSAWEDAADDNDNIAWTRGIVEAMKPHAADAVYVNYLDQEPVEEIRRAYGPEKFAKLVALKKKYDPGNLFRLNSNIPPDAS
ncbi:MAG: FAD-binding oxidoreductase [Pseudooceanicola sp.]